MIKIFSPQNFVGMALLVDIWYLIPIWFWFFIISHVFSPFGYFNIYLFNIGLLRYLTRMCLFIDFVFVFITQCRYFIRLLPKCIIFFGAFVNDIVFLNFDFHSSLLVYRHKIDFCLLMLYTLV